MSGIFEIGKESGVVIPSASSLRKLDQKSDLRLLVWIKIAEATKEGWQKSRCLLIPRIKQYTDWQRVTSLLKAKGYSVLLFNNPSYREGEHFIEVYIDRDEAKKRIESTKHLTRL